MKKVFYLLLFLAPFFAFAFTVPEKPTGFVQDYAKILNAEQASSLEGKLEAYEKQSTNEIAVVTIDSLDGDVIENVAQDIFTKWGFGKKDKNNGVLLLISVTDRKTRIHTGYGVEGYLTDLGTSYIQSDIITSAFREGKYSEGINGAVDKMIESLSGTQIVPENYYKFSNLKVNWDFVFFIVFVVIQFLIAILARSKSWWLGGVFGGILAIVFILFFGLILALAIPIFIILVLLGLFFDYSVSKAYKKHKDNGTNPPWFIGGGGFGGGGHSGGFGGFGGGFSGGGGSSGRW